MQHAAMQAYGRTTQTTANPRDLEAHLLLKAAAKLQAAKDDKRMPASEMREAVRYNRKLWTLLSTSATAAENPLPQAVKQNIGNIAMFVLRHCVEMEQQPVAERLGSLILINRELAAGLSGHG